MLDMTPIKYLLTRSILRASHFLAYTWMLDNILDGGSTLDFGSRVSRLPYMLAKLGFDVTCVDRDPDMINFQKKYMEHKVNWKTLLLTDDTKLPFDDQSFGMVTASGAIQQNFPLAKQTQIALELGRVIKPGGRLLINAAYAQKTYEDLGRIDKQIRLNLDDHKKYIWEPLTENGFDVLGCKFFYYVHNTNEGEYCEQEDANGILYRIDKREPCTCTP